MMIATDKVSPFYFLRHAQTDQNVKKSCASIVDIDLNSYGIEQATIMRTSLATIPLASVCSSPLKRVQQTKEIALSGRAYNDIILDELKECSSALWHLFRASEKRYLLKEEQNLIADFITTVAKGLEKALTYQGPILIIAHGGTYWALSQILGLQGERKIDNCKLVKISQKSTNVWQHHFI